jgi:CCR4-NOT transcriptional regulation complex NOT5 subunit
MQKNVDQILNSSETNIQKLKTISQNFGLFLKNKKKLDVEVNLTEDCKFKLISETIGKDYISNHFNEEKQNKFKIILLNDENENINKKNSSKNQNGKFMKHFRCSYENMIKDEDMRPTPKIKEKLGKLDDGIYTSCNLINNSVYSKFDLEALFVIFYFCEDNYERLLVAKELKKREWSFHKKFLVWFKRHGAPKEIHTLYEKGDFLIFDSEEKFIIKKKKDFLFEYKHLENDF